MISSNPAFQVLVASANSAALAAGSRLDQLAPGQVGIFSYATNLAIDGTTPNDNKQFYIAVGLDPLNTGSVVDIRKSIGNSIEKKGIRAFVTKPYQAAVNKVFLITFGKTRCNSTYALKFNFMSEEAYRNYGSNTPNKTYTGDTPACANCVDCADGDTNALIVDIANNIALDDENLLSTRFIDPTDGSEITDVDAWLAGGNALVAPTITSGTPSTTGGTIAAGVHHYAIVDISANGYSAAGPDISVTTTGSTSSIDFVYPVAGAAVTQRRLYRGTTAGVYTSYVVADLDGTFTEIGAAGTAGAAPTTGTANAGETLQLEVTVSAAQLYNYAQINLNYLNPRSTNAFLSFMDFGADTSAEITTDLVYEDGAGYDIVQMEYIAAGWQGSPYRQSGLYGLAFDSKYPPLASVSGQYWLASITHENTGIGGGQKYQTSLQNSIALPTANTTAIASVNAILHRIIDDASGNNSTVNGLFTAEFSEVFE